MKYISVVLAVLILVLSHSCKKEPHEREQFKKAKLTGTAEKGPFLKGSNVSIAELSEDLKPTGRVFTTEVVNDLGHFEINNLALVSPYVRITVDGFYFNEVSGQVSSSRITLNALADISRQNSVNVNVVTHLEQQRVERLVADGVSFDEAKRTAGNDILQAFFIDHELSHTADQISITDNNLDAVAVIAISAIMLNTISSEAELSGKLHSMAQQLATEGKLSEADGASIMQSIQVLDFESVGANLVSRYRSLGVEIVPESPVLEEAFFKTEANFLMAYNDALRRFSEYYQAYILFESAYTNVIEVAGNPRYREIALHQLTTNNYQVFQLWSSAYNCIQVFNLLVKEGTQSDLPLAKHITHYANVHLGYLYWSMMILWGEIPYVDPQRIGDVYDASTVSRTPMPDLIGYLQPVLEDAVREMPAANGLFSMDKSFPLSILARLSLLQGDFVKAKLYSEQVIGSGLFSLEPGPWHARELIYGYTRPVGEQPSPINQDYQSLIHAAVAVHYVTYPEIILAASEACFRLDEITAALSYLNQVRQSNGKQHLVATERETIRDALLDEIRSTLGKDGLWFSALKRNDRAESILGIPAYRTLLPIPEREIALNANMRQNPGY